MAEVLILQANGYWNSMGTALFTAVQLKGMGVDIAILFNEAAIAALAENKFDMSPPLAKYTATIKENMKKMGLSTDIMDFVKLAKSAGVPLYACAFWPDFLGVRGKLPPEIQAMEMVGMMKLIAEAKRIIGAL